MFCECVCSKERLTTKNGYTICEEHKVVHFLGCCSNDEKKKKITDYLNTVQSAVMSRASEYYEIEKKYINKRELSEDEKSIRKHLVKFRDIRIELSVLLNEYDEFNDKRVKHLLYRLLMISEWLNETFEITL